VVAGIATALRVGALSADAVAVEARKSAQADDAAAESGSADGRTRPAGNPVQIPEDVASLTTQRRLTTLPIDTRPPPSVAAYDQLLRRHQPPPAAASQGDAS
jgi:hypothetical protein